MVIACCALAYLVFARPWNQPNHSVAVDSYACVAAFLALALIPKGVRLWLVVGIALGVALLTTIALLSIS